MGEDSRELEDDRQERTGRTRVLRDRRHVAAYYDKLAPFYDRLADRSERPVRQKGLEMLGARAGETVLETGFGTGGCLVELAAAVGESGRVLGIDLSMRMVCEARRRLLREGSAGRVSPVRGDAGRLPYRDNSADAVFSSFTLEIFEAEEIPRVLNEWRRVLRPEGRLVVVSLTRRGRPDPMRGIFEWTHRHFPNLLDCHPICVRRRLQEAGFRIDDESIEHMWVPVELVRGRAPEGSP